MSGRGDDRIEAPPPPSSTTAEARRQSGEILKLRRRVIDLEARLASAKYILGLLHKDL